MMGSRHFFHAAYVAIREANDGVEWFAKLENQNVKPNIFYFRFTQHLTPFSQVAIPLQPMPNHALNVFDATHAVRNMPPP